MIECIFTLDYEIYGDGQGTLRELVYEPARKLKTIFDAAEAKLVVFVEVAELEKIEQFKTDPAIDKVKGQIREFHQAGHEIGLHLHPQWCHARPENGRWALDDREYNLCVLPEGRIAEIVKGSLGYLRQVLLEGQFTPLSFRAGNWLFQPARTAAKVLAEEGIRIDSSVFKGGRQHKYNLDYRGARKNGYYWAFRDDVNVPAPDGLLLEVPIYTRMAPFWKILTQKRLELQQKGPRGARTGSWGKFSRWRDFARLCQPLKLDFCRMNMDELVTLIQCAIREDQANPATYKPLVAIGHTKDLVDVDTIELFLNWLKKEGIPVVSFRTAQQKLESNPA